MAKKDWVELKLGSVLPNRRQYPLRGQRRFIDFNTYRRQRVTYCIGDRSRRDDRSAFAHALHAVFGRGRLGMQVADPDRRQFIGAGNVVIEKRRGEWLAVCIVSYLFVQGGADPLRYSAADLTSTSIGFTIVPQSSTTAKSRSSIAPVSGSTATPAPWVAYE